MNNAPLFSIVIPVYNVENYIELCLQSLKNQTDPCFEAIIVDDGSPDGSAAIAEKFVQSDPGRFHLFSKPNGGLSDARNFGLEKASGEYVIFLDSDDSLDIHTCEKLRVCINAENPDLIIFDYKNIYDDGHVINNKCVPSGGRSISKKEYLMGSPCAWNKVMHRSIYMENNIRFPVGLWYEDLAITGSYVNYADTIYFLDEYIFHYNQHPGSITNQAELPPKAMDRVKALEILESSLDTEAYRDEIEYIYISHIVMVFLPILMCYKGESLSPEVCDIMNRKFPNWPKNKYYKQKSGEIRLCGFLLRHKQFFLYKCLKNGLYILRKTLHLR